MAAIFPAARVAFHAQLKGSRQFVAANRPWSRLSPRQTLRADVGYLRGLGHGNPGGKAGGKGGNDRIARP